MTKTYNPRPMIEDIIAFMKAENQDKSEFKNLDVSWFAKEHCDSDRLQKLFDYAYLKDGKNVIHNVLKHFMINNPNFTRFVIEFEAPNTPTYRPLDYLDIDSNGIIYSYDKELCPQEVEEHLTCELFNFTAYFVSNYMKDNNITYSEPHFKRLVHFNMFYNYLTAFICEAHKRNLITLNGGI